MHMHLPNILAFIENNSEKKTWSMERVFHETAGTPHRRAWYAANCKLHFLSILLDVWVALQSQYLFVVGAKPFPAN